MFGTKRKRILTLLGMSLGSLGIVFTLAMPAMAQEWTHLYLKETSGSYRVGASTLCSGCNVEETIGGRFTSYTTNPNGTNCNYLGLTCGFISLDASNGTLCLVDTTGTAVTLGGCSANGSIWAENFSPDGSHIRFLNRYEDQHGLDAYLTGHNDGTLFYSDASGCTNSCYQKFKFET